MIIHEWLKTVKKTQDVDKVGMILVHNGVVRGKSKDGKKVEGMRLSFSPEKLDAIIAELKGSQGISDIRVWINEGYLKVGDDIMYVLVAGRTRKEVIPIFEELLERIKKEVVKEEEILCSQTLG